MSDYPSYPPPPPPDGPGGYGQPIRTEPPPSINTSMNIIWAALALQVISTILSFAYLDELLEASNAAPADEETARTIAIVSVVIFLIFAGLWVLLGMYCVRVATGTHRAHRPGGIGPASWGRRTAR